MSLTIDSVTSDLMRHFATEERYERDEQINDWRRACELPGQIAAAKHAYCTDVCSFMHTVDTDDTSKSEALRIAMQDLGKADAGWNELQAFKSAFDAYCVELAWKEIA